MRKMKQWTKPKNKIAVPINKNEKRNLRTIKRKNN